MRYRVILAICLIGLSACSRKTEKSEAIQEAVVANQNADSMLAWEGSEFTPEKLFADWNQKLVAKEIKVSGLCGDFSALSVEDLVLFENEIRSDANTALLQDCRGALMTRLDEYWQANKPLAVNMDMNSGGSNSFKFPDNVQTRDLSKGYFAYTGDVASKEVVLTFDDGPSALYTERILETLKEVNAKALFFNVGKNVKANPQIVEKVAAAGHSIGAHSMSHLCLADSNRCESNNHGQRLKMADAVADIKQTFRELFKVLGYVDPFFRFPYGESSKELQKYLADHQTGEFYWSIDSNDWRSKDSAGQPWTGGRMLESVMSELNGSHKKRGMILVHDIQRKTAEALPELLRRLYYDGYSLVLLKPADEQGMAHPKILGDDSTTQVP